MSTVQARKYLTLLVAGLLLLSCRSVFAADPNHQKAAASTKVQSVGDPYLLDTDVVTGEKLTKPVIIDYKGRELRFASQDSVKTFNADPAKYLPKIDEAMIKQQLPYYPLDKCVVTGETLGGDMGKPINYIYKNRLVRFCCSECKASFEKDPAKYLAKIDEAVIDRQKAGYALQTCPVSGEKLGEMGQPKDYVAGNRLIRFCCPSCIAQFNKDPLPTLTKIDEAGKPPHPAVLSPLD